MSDVITKVEGQVGRIRLNRPKAIHALTKDMCTAMIAALVEWRGDGGIQAVMIDHAEGRGFCAGGDVRMLAESGAVDGAEARAFFNEIGRAHVGTPVTNAHLVCRLLLVNKKTHKDS